MNLILYFLKNQNACPYLQYGQNIAVHLQCTYGSMLWKKLSKLYNIAQLDILKTPILQSLAFTLTCCFYLHTSYQTTAQGVVFLDANKNGQRDQGEKPLPDICVSNGQEVVVTDAEGMWSLPTGDDTFL